MKPWMTSGGGCDARRDDGIGGGRYAEAALRLLNRLQSADVDSTRPRVVHLPPVAAGEPLSLTTEPADAVYVIRRGALKRLTMGFSDEGCLSGLHPRGSVISPLSDLCAGWEDKLVALQKTWLCRVRLTQCRMRIRQQLLRLRSASLRDEWEFHRQMLAASAVQRLTAFVLRLGPAMHGANFRLPMADSDIAEYLHLEPQALRCAKHELIGCGWLQMVGRHVRITDPPALQKLLGD